MNNEQLIYCETNIDLFNTLKDKINNDKNVRLMLMDKSYSEIFDNSIKRNDNEIWFYSGKYYIKRSYQSNIYLKCYEKKGFKYDFHTKKITVWFGTVLRSLMIKHIFKFLECLGCDWFKKMFKCQQYSNISPNLFFTKTILEKIINKKINNPRELLIFYSKINLKYNTNQWKKLAVVLNNTSYCNFLLGNSKVFQCTYNPFDTIINIVNNDISRNKCEKIFEYYNIMNKKINAHLWSINRFNNESEHIECEMVKAKLSTYNHENLLPYKQYHIIHNNNKYEIIDNTIDLYLLYRMMNKTTYESISRVNLFEQKKAIFVKVTTSNGEYEIFRLSISILDGNFDNILDKYYLNIMRYNTKVKIQTDEIREALLPIKNKIINFLLENKNVKTIDDIIDSSARFDERFEIEF